MAYNFGYLIGALASPSSLRILPSMATLEHGMSQALRTWIDFSVVQHNSTRICRSGPLDLLHLPKICLRKRLLLRKTYLCGGLRH